MSIWRTTIPTPQDYPIWAFTDSDTDVILLRYPEDFGEPITWCHALIPQLPKSHIRHKYEVLSKNSVGQAWGTYEWFKAGYDYGKLCKGNCGCDKGQALKANSIGIDGDRWSAPWSEECAPKESAHDEQL